jgi:hypothetical protein
MGDLLPMEFGLPANAGPLSEGKAQIIVGNSCQAGTIPV